MPKVIVHGPFLQVLKKPPLKNLHLKLCFNLYKHIFITSNSKVMIEFKFIHISYIEHYISLTSSCITSCLQLKLT